MILVWEEIVGSVWGTNQFLTGRSCGLSWKYTENDLLRLFVGSNLLIGGSDLSMPVKAYKENDFTSYAPLLGHQLFTGGSCGLSM